MDETLKSWAYTRPYCQPASGNVVAKTASEALQLVHRMHGYANGTRAFCAETGEEWLDDYSGLRQVRS